MGNSFAPPMKKQSKPKTRPNLTGIPAQMKQDFEHNSGLSFEDVRVHYNSDRPALLHSAAYTQGTQVYIAPGQERFLPHELGHVIQQKTGIIKPSVMLGGVGINTDRELELSADQIAAARGRRNGNSQILESDMVQAVQCGDFDGVSIGIEREFKNVSLYLMDDSGKKYLEISDPIVAEVFDANTNQCLFTLARDAQRPDLLYTLELATTPTERGDYIGLKKRREAISLLMEQLKKVEKSGDTPSLEDFLANIAVSTTNFECRFKINNPKVHIKISGGINSYSHHVSIGMPMKNMDDIENFLTNHSGAWFTPNKYKLDPKYGGTDLDQKLYNYIMCMIIFQTRLQLTGSKNIRYSEGKGKWGTPPRTPVSFFLNGYENGEKIRSAVKNTFLTKDLKNIIESDSHPLRTINMSNADKSKPIMIRASNPRELITLQEYKNNTSQYEQLNDNHNNNIEKVYNNAKNMILYYDLVPIHTPVKATIQHEPALVFEIRNPDTEWDPFVSHEEMSPAPVIFEIAQYVHECAEKLANKLNPQLKAAVDHRSKSFSGKLIDNFIKHFGPRYFLYKGKTSDLDIIKTKLYELSAPSLESLDQTHLIDMMDSINVIDFNSIMDLLDSMDKLGIKDVTDIIGLTDLIDMIMEESEKKYFEAFDEHFEAQGKNFKDKYKPGTRPPRWHM